MESNDKKYFIQKVLTEISCLERYGIKYNLITIAQTLAQNDEDLEEVKDWFIEEVRSCTPHKPNYYLFGNFFNCMRIIQQICLHADDPDTHDAISNCFSFFDDEESTVKKLYEFLGVGREIFATKFSPKK